MASRHLRETHNVPIRHENRRHEFRYQEAPEQNEFFNDSNDFLEQSGDDEFEYEAAEMLPDDHAMLTYSRACADKVQYVGHDNYDENYFRHDMYRPYHRQQSRYHDDQHGSRIRDANQQEGYQARYRDPYQAPDRIFRQERDQDRDQEEIYRKYMEGQYHDSNSGSSESSQVCNDKPKKICLGINAKPTSSVQEQLRYPHFSLGQISGFINTNLQFHNLSYEQFAAGELVTINNSISLAKRQG